jgi:transcriptional antiterminator RfaH
VHTIVSGDVSHPYRYRAPARLDRSVNGARSPRCCPFAVPVQYRRAFELVDDIYLPLLRAKVRRLGRIVELTEPLFPCYLFARFNLEQAHHKLKYCPGVTDILCTGGELCEVDVSIINKIKSRETNGLILLDEQKLQPRQRVSIIEGPFRGIEAVFERYLSAAERVAVLLENVGGTNLRAVLRADSILPIDSPRVV